MPRCLAFVVLLLGCQPSPPTSGAGDESGSETGDGVCKSTSECLEGQACAAPYDGDGVRGENECQAECIPEQAEQLWCVDDAACCGALICDALGLCVPEPVETETETGG